MLPCLDLLLLKEGFDTLLVFQVVLAWEQMRLASPRLWETLEVISILGTLILLHYVAVGEHR